MAMSEMKKRPPVVVVMGHVDHGKTSLLDYIRKANVAGKEAGGITQGTGAYEVAHNGERITFIDTPGHEAFSKMRARGANIADVAILLVAATDGVQNQTKEAIKVLKQTETPFVVAINKIDKASDADIQNVKNQLLSEEVFLEGFGGATSYQGVSAKTGAGIPELLDLILLAADVEGLTYDPETDAEGFILESRLDTRKGNIANVILKNGTLRTGDNIQAGAARGRVKVLENFLGKKESMLIPSSPASIFGFEILPAVGDKFIAGNIELKDIASATTAKTKAVAPAEGLTILNFVLKGDVSGSLEALSGIIKSLPRPESVHVEIIGEGVGEITDGDVKSALANKSAIIAFRVKPTKAAAALALASSVKIIQSEIIYDLVKVVEEMIKTGTTLKIVGDLEILALFGKRSGKKQVLGGKVVAGEIKNSFVLEMERRGEILGKGRIINLQSQKKDVAVVASGAECGMLFESDTEPRVGDHLVFRQ